MITKIKQRCFSYDYALIILVVYTVPMSIYISSVFRSIFDLCIIEQYNEFSGRQIRWPFHNLRPSSISWLVKYSSQWKI